MFGFDPILAIDISGLIAVAFLVISFIGWLSNLVSNQQKPPAPQGRRPQQRPRNRQVQDEIDAFLREATGGGRRGPKPAGRQRPAEIVAGEDIEIVEPPEPRRPPLSERPVPAATASEHERPGPVERSQQRSERRSERTEFRETAAAERLRRELAKGMPQTVDQSVAIHLGAFTGEESTGRRYEEETTRDRQPVGRELLRSLRHRTGVRNAIILGEVLGPSLARRQK